MAAILQDTGAACQSWKGETGSHKKGKGTGSAGREAGRLVDGGRNVAHLPLPYLMRMSRCGAELLPSLKSSGRGQRVTAAASHFKRIASHPPVPSGSSSSFQLGPSGCEGTRQEVSVEVVRQCQACTVGKGPLSWGGGGFGPGEPPFLVPFPSSNQQPFTKGM